jgi:NAD(P)-dependent dehydrogenase (short-subunit alcohol dehydrogenase family)
MALMSYSAMSMTMKAYNSRRPLERTPFNSRANISRCAYIRTDVQSWSSLSKLFETTLDACRQIDIVVANAGLQTTSFWKDKLDSNGELQEPDWQVIDTNLKGIMATVKLSLHYFQKNKEGGGRCVIVGSPDGYFRGSKQSGPNAEYVATEHGVNPPSSHTYRRLLDF